MLKMCAISASLTAGIVFLIAPLPVSPTPAPATSPVKLIEYGWDTPSPDFVRAHIREMERRPFDGVIMRLSDGGGDVFQPHAWDAEKLAPQLPALRAIQWQSFDSNFLAMYATSSMDWFDDTDWGVVTAHAAFMARAARACRCTGLMFDPEPYGPSPWTYPEQVHAGERTFGDYQVIVRRRGREFMRALQQEYSGIELLTLHGYSYFPGVSSSADVELAMKGLMAHPWGLLPAFFDGLLEEADPETRIIDGSERSYFFEHPDQFLSGAETVRRGTLPFVAKELQEKYARQVQVGQSLYLDWIFGRFTLSRPSVTNGLRSDQRAQLAEHHAYHALRSADRYVWTYSEKMNWWTDENVPAGAASALRSAKSKVTDNQPLGFNLASILRQSAPLGRDHLREK